MNILCDHNAVFILQMGKNPMQSAGCYGICAAILRNPNCVIEVLDFSVSYNIYC